MTGTATPEESAAAHGARWITAALVIVGLCNYGYALLVTHLLDVAAYSTFAAGQGLIMWASTVAMVSVPWVLAQALARARPGAEQDSALRFAKLASAGSGVIAATVVGTIATGFAGSETALALALSTFVIFLSATPKGSLQGRERMRVLSALSAAENLVKNGARVLLVMLAGAGETGALAAFGIGGIVFLGWWPRTPRGTGRAWLAAVASRDLWRRAAGIAGAQVVVHIYPLYRRDIISGRIAPADAGTLHGVSDVIQRLACPGPGLVLAPLGIGGHVDHVLVRTAAERSGARVGYYSDFPYNQRHPAVPAFVQAANGQIHGLWEAKTSGIQRMLGLVQATGFHSSGGGDLPGRVIAEANFFGTTYLVLMLTVPALVVLLRRGGPLPRMLGLLCCAAGVTLGYALVFGTLEEQELYLLIVPSLVSIPVAATLLHAGGRGRSMPAPRRRRMPRTAVIAAVLTLALTVNLVTCVWWLWQPDDGFAQLLQYMAKHVPAGAQVDDDDSQYAIAGRYQVVSWDTPAALSQDHVRYIVVEWALINDGYSDLTASQVRQLVGDGRLVFSFRGRTFGQIALYQLPPPPGPAPGGHEDERAVRPPRSQNRPVIRNPQWHATAGHRSEP